MLPNITAETTSLELTEHVSLASTHVKQGTCQKRFFPKFHNVLESTLRKSRQSGCRQS